MPAEHEPVRLAIYATPGDAEEWREIQVALDDSRPHFDSHLGARILESVEPPLHFGVDVTNMVAIIVGIGGARFVTSFASEAGKDAWHSLKARLALIASKRHARRGRSDPPVATLEDYGASCSVTAVIRSEDERAVATFLEEAPHQMAAIRDRSRSLPDGSPIGLIRIEADPDTGQVTRTWARARTRRADIWSWSDDEARWVPSAQ